jgi:mRNA interferase RelE/StbE
MVYVVPKAWNQLKRLPGKMRQRVRRAIDELGANPHPPQSKRLAMPETASKLYRLRLDQWRVVYVIDETQRRIYVLTVRKRPPYNYDDLDDLVQVIQN